MRRRLLLLAWALAACDARTFSLGQEHGGAPTVIAPAACFDDRGVARACAGSVRWWFTLGDERDDRVNGVAVDDVGRVYVTGDLAIDWRNAWRPDAFLTALGSAGHFRWSTLLEHHNRNWADSGVGVVWDATSGVGLVGQRGLNGHQYGPYLDEFDAGGGSPLRTLNLFDTPPCPTSPCHGVMASQEVSAIARTPGGTTWVVGVMKDEPGATLPWLQRPVAADDVGFGLIAAFDAPDGRAGRTLGDRRVHKLTDVALAPEDEVCAVGLSRPAVREDPSSSKTLFLLRITRTLEVRWVRELTSTGIVSTPRLATDGEGRLYVTAAFTGSLDLGGRTLTSSAGYTGFLAGFDVDGALSWVTSWPTGDQALGHAVEIDGDRVLLAAGVHGAPGAIAPLTTAGAFLAAFTRSGRQTFGMPLTSGGPASPRALTRTRDGLVIVGGAFSARLELPGRTLAVSAGDTDGFVQAVTPP